MAVVSYTLQGKRSTSLGGHTSTKAHTAEVSVLAQILSDKIQDHQRPYQNTTEVSKLKGLAFISGNLN